MKEVIVNWPVANLDYCITCNIDTKTDDTSLVFDGDDIFKVCDVCGEAKRPKPLKYMKVPGYSNPIEYLDHEDVKW